MKKVFLNYPDWILLALTGAVWLGERRLNPALMIITGLLLLMIVTRSKLLGILSGVGLGMISAFMLLAVYSEFSKFKVLNADALRLVIFGTLLFLFTGALSLLVGRKYSQRPVVAANSATA